MASWCADVRLSRFGCQMDTIATTLGGSMPVRSRNLVFGVGVAAVYGVMLTAGQAPAGSGPFTAAQATAGRTAYQASCAGCHGADLMGVPALAGPGFIGPWSTRTTRDLFTTIRESMPSD